MAKEVVEAWASKVGQAQVIGQAELFPLFVARLTWGARLAGRRVFYFVDNDSARLAMVKSYSPVLSSLDIVMQCLSWDSQHDSSSWYARVPTSSNIADGPSRMDAKELVSDFGALIVSPSFPAGIRATDILG